MHSIMYFCAMCGLTKEFIKCWCSKLLYQKFTIPIHGYYISHSHYYQLILVVTQIFVCRFWGQTIPSEDTRNYRFCIRRELKNLSNSWSMENCIYTVIGYNIWMLVVYGQTMDPFCQMLYKGLMTKTLNI